MAARTWNQKKKNGTHIQIGLYVLLLFYSKRADINVHEYLYRYFTVDKIVAQTVAIMLRWMFFIIIKSPNDGF